MTSALPVRQSWSPGSDYVRLDGRLEDLNKIFNARFRRWERRLNGRMVHFAYRTNELAVPAAPGEPRRRCVFSGAVARGLSCLQPGPGPESGL